MRSIELKVKDLQRGDQIITPDHRLLRVVGTGPGMIRGTRLIAFANGEFSNELPDTLVRSRRP
jgi:hypothetical protein